MYSSIQYKWGLRFRCVRRDPADAAAAVAAAAADWPAPARIAQRVAPVPCVSGARVAGAAGWRVRHAGLLPAVDAAGEAATGLMPTQM